MRSIYILFTFLLLTSWGCSENNALIDPVKQTNTSVTQNVTTEPNWIKLPAPKYPKLQKSFSLTQLILANENCSMTIDETYYDVDNNHIRVCAEIKFLAGTINQNTEITTHIEDETGVLAFLPHMNFNKEAILWV